jgi:hypothetical protein
MEALSTNTSAVYRALQKAAASSSLTPIFSNNLRLRFQANTGQNGDMLW